MAEDILLALERAKTDIIDTLAQKPFWDRVLPVFQAALLLIGGFWAVFTYYVNRHDRALTPAKISVQPILNDLGVHQGLRFVRVTIVAENRGARAYVVNSPYLVSAHKIKPAPPAKAPAPANEPALALWDRSFAAEEKRDSIRSGEAFRHGDWFETGERASRSYIVAVPEGMYDIIDVNALVRHVKVEDSSLGTTWRPQSDGSLKAETIVYSGEKTEAYRIPRHDDLRKRTSMASNEGEASLVLWTVPSAIASTVAPQKKE